MKIIKLLGMLVLPLLLGFLIALAGGVEWGTPAAGAVAAVSAFAGLVLIGIEVID
ncbi:TPA: hypothetical protein ACNIQM_001827 [Citrobacter werkmanii]